VYVALVTTGSTAAIDVINTWLEDSFQQLEIAL